MATLHVRNVPDALYERLRARAERNGRSIGAETVVLLEAQLVVLPLHSGPRRRRRSASDRFVPYGRETVAAAQEEARELGHEAVGTEHLLLALLHKLVGAVTLSAVGLDYAEARARVARVEGGGDPVGSGSLPLTAAAKTALELALREALDAGSVIITHEDLLLGIVRESDGLGARIVEDHGLSLDDLRALVRPKLFPKVGPAGGAFVFEARRPFRVVELEGTPREWEHQLTAASAGYELVEIVDRRAIFQAAETTESTAARKPLT
jgi:hypothetical protein